MLFQVWTMELRWYCIYDSMGKGGGYWHITTVGRKHVQHFGAEMLFFLRWHMDFAGGSNYCFFFNTHTWHFDEIFVEHAHDLRYSSGLGYGSSPFSSTIQVFFNI